SAILWGGPFVGLIPKIWNESGDQYSVVSGSLKTKLPMRVSRCASAKKAVILVFLFGFFVLGFLAYRTYTVEPPIPVKVVDPDGRVLFTRDNIMAGQGTSYAMV